SATISARRDRLRLIIWGVAVGLGLAASLLHGSRVGQAARSTAEPFLTLAVVILIGVLGERAGVFRFVSRALVPETASPRVAFAAVLLLTAVVSGLINLDVAVVVAIPIALDVADERGLAAGWLVVAVATTANATS